MDTFPQGHGRGFVNCDEATQPKQVDHIIMTTSGLLSYYTQSWFIL